MRADIRLLNTTLFSLKLASKATFVEARHLPHMQPRHRHCLIVQIQYHYVWWVSR